MQHHNQFKIQVKKRDSKLESLDIQKVHKVLEWATEGINNVSISEIELQSGLQFTNGIETSDIQKILIKASADLISERFPNYQYVAARLLLMELRKEVYQQFEPKPLLETVIKNIDNNYYENIFEFFTAEQINYYDSKINYQKDFDFTYAGLRTIIDKFTVTNKKTSKIFETPQQIFMLVSMMLFKNSTSNRKKDIIDFYNALSSFKISLPSPIMAGLRTPTKGYASCCLIDMGDTKESLTAANAASVIMTTIKSGIGLYGGSIRGIGAGVSNNTVKHTGNVPILKWFESAVKSFSQGSRGGSATVYYPFYHYEIEKILTLKSNKSTEENSVKKLDYGIGINQLVWDRAQLKEDVTLFSPEEARNLDLFLNDYEKWLKEYKRLENTKGLRTKKIPARTLIENFASEAFETGRYYPLFLDNANKGPLKSVIKMSNLCLSGDTIIKTNHGEMSLKECVEFNESENLKVLSYNILKNKNEYKKITAKAMTNPKSKVLKITDTKTGKFIKCTEYHKIWTENRGYVLAKDLNENDILKLEDI